MKFTFPTATVEFELIIASTMDVYLVTVETGGEKRYFEDAYTKSQITEELARQLLEESEEDEPKNKITIVDSKGTRTLENIDLGKSFEKHKEVNQLLRDWDQEPLGDRIEDYEGSEPTYHKWDMER